MGLQIISQLAILAGYEMSEQSYAQYNTVVLEFLEVSGLLADFQVLAGDARRMITKLMLRCRSNMP